jgi:hypothetical protein
VSDEVPRRVRVRWIPSWGARETAETDSSARLWGPAVLALIGVLVGGFVSYLGNKALQDAEGRTAARGAARVLLVQLTEREDAIRFYVDPPPALVRDERSRVKWLRDWGSALEPIGLQLSDRKLIAMRLKIREWTTLNNAIGNYTFFRGNLRANVKGQPSIQAILPPEQNGLYQNGLQVADDLRAAAGALARLAAD